MIATYIQNYNGNFKKASYELASYTSAIAKMFSTQSLAITFGNVNEQSLQSLFKYGIDKAIVFETNCDVFDATLYSSKIAEIGEKYQVKGFIFSNNNQGRVLAPRISAKFNAGLVTAVSTLPESTNPLKITKSVFTGKAFAKISIKTEKFVLTLFQNSFSLVEEPKNPQIERIPLEQTASLKLIERNQDISGKILLTDADIVVSGGRGMKGPEYWKPLEELAEVLGGACACSRPVSDEGWRPHSEHVGQTGKIIAPQLYIALGISGAIQHMGGVSNSKCIVAINNDKDAPIFEYATYGLVADVHKVLPELIEEIKKAKQM